MYNFVKKGAWMLLVACVAVGMVSCGDDDPDYSNVQPPMVEVAASNISGVVTAMDGKALKGATVKATAAGKSLSATTDEKGAFVLGDLNKGTYSMEVSAAGKLTVNGEVVIAKDGESAVFNAMLANEGKKVAVSQAEEKVVNVVTETLPDNKEAEVETKVVIPAAAVAEKDAEIVLTPVYNETVAASTRAAVKEDAMLMGMMVACNKAGVQLNKPVALSFNVGAEVAKLAVVKKFANGKWSNVAAKVEGDKMNVEADEFGTYSIFLNVAFDKSVSAEAIQFNTAKFDNLYGSKNMFVKEATYTYKQGAEMNVSGSSLMAAYLRQILVNRVNAVSMATATGTYALNVTLPIGTALNLNGSQAVTTLQATVGSASGSVKTFGNVTVVASTYNRHHIGGSN